MGAFLYPLLFLASLGAFVGIVLLTYEKVMGRSSSPSREIDVDKMPSASCCACGMAAVCAEQHAEELDREAQEAKCKIAEDEVNRTA